MTDRNEYRMHHNLVRETLSAEQLQRQADAVADYHKRLQRRAIWRRAIAIVYTLGGAAAIVSAFLIATN